MSTLPTFPTDFEYERRLDKARKDLELVIHRHAFCYRDTDAVHRVASHYVDSMINRIQKAEDVPYSFQKEAHLYLDLYESHIIGPNSLVAAKIVDFPSIKDPLERIGFGTAVLEDIRARIPAHSIPDTHYQLLVDQQVQANLWEIALGAAHVRMALVYRAYK